MLGDAMSAPSAEAGKALFTKPCGGAAPTEAQWPELNSEDVPFTDPTQRSRASKPTSLHSRS